MSKYKLELKKQNTLYSHADIILIYRSYNLTWHKEIFTQNKAPCREQLRCSLHGAVATHHLAARAKRGGANLVDHLAGVISQQAKMASEGKPSTGVHGSTSGRRSRFEFRCHFLTASLHNHPAPPNQLSRAESLLNSWPLAFSN